MSLRNMIVTIECDKCGEKIRKYFDGDVTPKDIRNETIRNDWDFNPNGDCEDLHYCPKCKEM